MKIKRLIAIAGAAVMLLSACNDSDTPNAESTPTAEATTVAPEPTSEPEQEPTGSYSAPDRDQWEACDRLFSKRGQDNELIIRATHLATDLNEQPWNSDLDTRVRNMNDELSAAWRVASDDLREQIDIVQEPFAAIRDVLASGGGSVDTDTSGVQGAMLKSMEICNEIDFKVDGRQ